MVKFEGPLGFPRLTGVGPFVNRQLAAAQQAQPELSREEFIRRCQQSESSERFARNFAAAFIGEENVDRLPIESLQEAEEDFCEGLADFFGLG